MVQLKYVFNCSFAATDDNCLGPEGMEKFCEDIGVEPENVSENCHIDDILVPKSAVLLCILFLIFAYVWCSNVSS